MCLAIPTRVVELLPDNQAVVDLGGVQGGLLELVDEVAVGDYVIIHVGYALTRLDPEEAAHPGADGRGRHRRGGAAA
jgi:hydrogenase expression/formation protein HypC